MPAASARAGYMILISHFYERQGFIVVVKLQDTFAHPQHQPGNDSVIPQSQENSTK